MAMRKNHHFKDKCKPKQKIGNLKMNPGPGHTQSLECVE